MYQVAYTHLEALKGQALISDKALLTIQSSLKTCLLNLLTHANEQRCDDFEEILKFYIDLPKKLSNHTPLKINDFFNLHKLANSPTYHEEFPIQTACKDTIKLLFRDPFQKLLIKHIADTKPIPTNKPNKQVFIDFLRNAWKNSARMFIKGKNKQALYWEDFIKYVEEKHAGISPTTELFDEWAIEVAGFKKESWELFKSTYTQLQPLIWTSLKSLSVNYSQEAAFGEDKHTIQKIQEDNQFYVGMRATESSYLVISINEQGEVTNEILEGVHGSPSAEESNYADLISPGSHFLCFEYELTFAKNGVQISQMPALIYGDSEKPFQYEFKNNFNELRHTKSNLDASIKTLKTLVSPPKHESKSEEVKLLSASDPDKTGMVDQNLLEHKYEKALLIALQTVRAQLDNKENENDESLLTKERYLLKEGFHFYAKLKYGMGLESSYFNKLTQIFKVLEPLSNATNNLQITSFKQKLTGILFSLLENPTRKNYLAFEHLFNFISKYNSKAPSLNKFYSEVNAGFDDNFKSIGKSSERLHYPPTIKEAADQFVTLILIEELEKAKTGLASRFNVVEIPNPPQKNQGGLFLDWFSTSSKRSLVTQADIQIETLKKEPSSDDISKSLAIFQLYQAITDSKFDNLTGIFDKYPYLKDSWELFWENVQLQINHHWKKNINHSHIKEDEGRFYRYYYILLAHIEKSPKNNACENATDELSRLIQEQKALSKSFLQIDPADEKKGKLGTADSKTKTSPNTNCLYNDFIEFSDTLKNYCQQLLKEEKNTKTNEHPASKAFHTFDEALFRQLLLSVLESKIRICLQSKLTHSLLYLPQLTKIAGLVDQEEKKFEAKQKNPLKSHKEIICLLEDFQELDQPSCIALAKQLTFLAVAKNLGALSERLYGDYGKNLTTHWEQIQARIHNFEQLKYILDWLIAATDSMTKHETFDEDSSLRIFIPLMMIDDLTQLETEKITPAMERYQGETKAVLVEITNSLNPSQGTTPTGFSIASAIQQMQTTTSENNSISAFTDYKVTRGKQKQDAIERLSSDAKWSPLTKYRVQQAFGLQPTVANDEKLKVEMKQEGIAIKRDMKQKAIANLKFPNAPGHGQDRRVKKQLSIYNNAAQKSHKRLSRVFVSLHNIYENDHASMLNSKKSILANNALRNDFFGLTKLPLNNINQNYKPEYFNSIAKYVIEKFNVVEEKYTLTSPDQYGIQRINKFKSDLGLDFKGSNAATYNELSIEKIALAFAHMVLYKTTRNENQWWGIRQGKNLPRILIEEFNLAPVLNSLPHNASEPEVFKAILSHLHKKSALFTSYSDMFKSSFKDGKQIETWLHQKTDTYMNLQTKNLKESSINLNGYLSKRRYIIHKLIAITSMISVILLKEVAIKHKKLKQIRIRR